MFHSAFTYISEKGHHVVCSRINSQLVLAAEKTHVSLKKIHTVVLYEQGTTWPGEPSKNKHKPAVSFYASFQC